MKRMYEEIDVFAANGYRKKYLAGIEQYIEACTAYCDDVRRKEVTPERMKEQQGAYRVKFIEMLGQPLTHYEHSVPEAKQWYVGEDDYGKVYRVTICTIGSVEFYGLLWLPKIKAKKYPLLIVQHGGGGTPELLCDMHGQNNYTHISKIALENGFAVFAPQLLLWNFHVGDRLSYGEDMNFNRGELDSKLKQRGGSVTAFEIYNIRKSLDYLETLDFIDETKIGMIGLSYGGYFTLHTMAVETRIRAAYSCAAFNDRNQVKGFHDWRYQSASMKFYDAEVAGLCAPRPLYIDVGKKDEVFNWEGAVPEAERAKSFYDVYGDEAVFRFNLWEGGHRIDVDGPWLGEFFAKVKSNKWIRLA